MQKLLAHPVVVPFFLIFGLLLTHFGHAYLKRGSFQYTPQHGTTQIISPTTNGTVYWTITAGALGVGLLLIAIGAYAGVCLFRASRAPQAEQERPRFSMFALGFAIFIIVFAVITTLCSRH